ncbi:etoposide-induced protein 2.4 homolog [Oppia nitens]|uniref:etoposide-induced protein 2.4 homolog n=1 Tax=Oppia nitens TaxID=1686743 RepID=UPI0023DC821C|nr:etoposide-induced protein 2.4 homolog [Oppia nitens]
MNILRDIMIGVTTGVYDAMVGMFAIRRVVREDSGGDNANNIMKRIIECIVFNGGVFLLSIVLFNHVILSLLYLLIQFIFGSQEGVVSMTWFWLEPMLSYFFSVFWVLPLFLLSRVVNALWFQDIADNAFRGRQRSFRNIPVFIADTFFSLLIQILFLIQSMVVKFLPIPFVGQLAAIFHLSLLYSLYSFEYKWFNLGWELHRRLHFIEKYWTYFLGFGLPLAIVTYLIPSYYLSGAMFSIFFPLYIISANEARPRLDICNNRIKIFSPVVWISNKILFFVFQLNLWGRRNR